MNSAAMQSNAVERDVMEYDVAIVGGGPAGLACAIRLKQLKPDTNICVLEKASAVGAHALSGAVMEPGPLDALLPQWRQSLARDLRTVPSATNSTLPDTHRQRAAAAAAAHLHNTAVAISSSRWGSSLRGWRSKLEALGVDVFPGFAAAAPLFNPDESVAGDPPERHGCGKGRHARTELHARSRYPRSHDNNRRRRTRQHYQTTRSATTGWTRALLPTKLRPGLQRSCGSFRKAVSSRD